MLQHVRFPTSAPVTAAVLAGPDSSMWIQRARPVTDMDGSALRVASAVGYGSNHWDVFDADGSYLGVIALPETFRLARITDNALYGWMDNAAGEPIVRRLFLIRP